MLIAAHAITVDAILVTNDRAFGMSANCLGS
jgi:predicted nucleic acid-binding protein